MKKLAFKMVILLLLVSPSLIACQQKTADPAELTAGHIVDFAKIISYDTAQDVIADSVLIVEVTKLREEPFSQDLGYGAAEHFTLSHVQVNQVIRPMDRSAIKAGDELRILESEWTDPLAPQIIHHTEGYVKMTVQKDYTLYLGHNKGNDTFYPLGLLYGKIPHDPEEAVIWGDTLDPQIASVLKELNNKADPAQP